MKQKFTSLDVRAMVSSLRGSGLQGSRVLNVYDLNPKTFVLKLASMSNSKEFLLIESGARFHLVEEMVKKEAFPSGTAMALRKHLKNKKIESVSQVGFDRVVVIQFGVGANAVRLVIELYAKGNVVLLEAQTDTIVLVLRQFAYDEDNSLKKGLKYPFHLSTQNVPYLTAPDDLARRELVQETLTALASQAAPGSGTASLKAALGKLLPFAHPALVTKAAEAAAAVAGASLEEQTLRGADFITEQFARASEATVPGFCSATDFAPVAAALVKGGSGTTCGFGEMVRSFFGSFEKEREARQLEQFREGVWAKVAKTRTDQEGRIAKLREAIERLQRDAETVEEHLAAVEEKLLRVLQLVALGLDWAEVRDRVVAGVSGASDARGEVEEMDLKRGRVKMWGVWLEVELTGQQNVEKQYETKKQQSGKLRKSETQLAKTMAELERTAKAEVAKFEEKLQGRRQALQKKKLWWEKFVWFVTSENLLVLAGRDAQQNELLYKRYLKTKDIWIHADIAGAASVVVKSGNARDYPTMASLVEAGQFALCLSKAWESKIVTSAYWVFADQVSKTAPSGEFLGTGSFMVRGRKNFLPHARLEMGLGLLFLLTAESALTDVHKDERRVKSDPVARDLDADRLVAELSLGGLVATSVSTSTAAPAREKAKHNREKAVDSKAVASAPASAPAAGSAAAKEGVPVSSRTATRKANKEKQKQRKYGEWASDDSEHELRKILVGAACAPKAASASAASASAAAASVARAADASHQADQDAQAKACYVCGETGHLAFDCPRRQQQLQLLQREQRVDGAGGDVDAACGSSSSSSADEEEEDGGEFGVLRRLTLAPVEEDEVLRVLPMCAPLGALSGAREGTKLKLTPGSMKRGQAAALAVKLWQGAAEASGSQGVGPRLRGAVKTVSSEEVIETLGMSSLKVNAPGAQKLRDDIKKAKKKEKFGKQQ